MKVGGFVYAIPGATPEAGASVAVYLSATNALVTTATTDALGAWTASIDGYPGAVYAKATARGVTRPVDIGAGGHAGPLFAEEIPAVLRALPSGVMGAVAGQLTPAILSAIARTTTVSAGAALLRGYPFQTYAATTLQHALQATLARVDTVVARLSPFGAPDAGRTLLAVVAGTPAASPVAPTLTDSAATYELPICDVRVGPTGIESVTDRRVFAYDRTTVSAPTLVARAGSADSVALSSLFGSSPAIGLTVADPACQSTLTLLAGVVYDVEVAYSHVRKDTTSDTGADYGALAFVGGDAGAAAYDPSLGFTGVYLSHRFVHRAQVAGTGAAVAVGGRLVNNASGSNKFAVSGRWVTAVATPRR